MMWSRDGERKVLDFPEGLMKNANLAFHYSERLKSNFLLVMRAVTGMDDLLGQRLEGAKGVMKSIFSGLLGEISIARKYLPESQLDFIENKVLEAEVNMGLCRVEEVLNSLAEGLSQVTTLCNRYINLLRQKDLI
jgi:hypothetical protein